MIMAGQFKNAPIGFKQGMRFKTALGWREVLTVRDGTANSDERSILCVLILGVGIGCASLSEYLAPAAIDQQAVEYAASAGVAEPNDFAGYANLEKAIRLETAVASAYEVKALALTQMQEKNKLDYEILRGVVATNSAAARDRETQLFGETGLLSLGMTALGFGGLTGLLGLMRKRPGDITTQEMEQAVASIKGEVTTKDKQIIEIVKGVQKFLDKNPKGSISGDELRACLGEAESMDTKQTVAVAKAGLI